MIADLTVAPHATLREVMERINTNLRGIALVVDDQGRLLGAIVDGDVRRAMLASIGLDTTAADILQARGDARPITAAVGASPDALLELMRRHSVRQIPLIDSAGRLADLVTLDDLLPGRGSPLRAMIMAGGHGARLRPLTEDTPKPMLPVGGRPLMEVMIERLRHAGITQFHIATHYKSDKIVDHFGSGDRLGVELHYLTEDQPRGTAGALSMIPAPADTMLVINGDILTDIDFNAMLAFHREYNAVLTVAVRKYEMSVPFGVIESDGVFTRALTEKPQVGFFVNAGIYLLEPEAHRFISDREHLDMPDLIRRLLDAGQVVVNFPVLEYWIDIGAPHDYVQAQEDAKRMGGKP